MPERPAAPEEGTERPLPREALRILAHPVRSRIVAELRFAGPATATDLAAALETNTGVTSYHLRRLAEAGLVRDTGAGVGRRREWEASTEGRPMPEESDVDDETATDWLAHDYVEHFAEKAHAWLDARSEWPLAWQDSCGLSDALVLVTGEQMEALQAELEELLARYRRVGAGSPSAKRVAFFTAPLPVDPPPGSRR